MYTDEDIVREIKKGWSDFIRFEGRSSVVEIVQTPAATLVVSDVPWGIHTGVLPTDQGALTEEVVETVKEFFLARGKRTFFWRVPPGVHASTLGETLEPLGFSYSKGAAGMALPADRIQQKGELPVEAVGKVVWKRSLSFEQKVP